MKKIIGIFIAMCIAVSAMGVIAQSSIGVFVNGALLETDQPPIIENGRTLVPMRAIFEALDYRVEYYEEEKMVVAQKGVTILSLVIDEKTMLLNWETEIALDVPARIENQRTLVPLRAVSEALGAYVEWNETERAVYIESRQGAHNIERKLLTQKVEDRIDFEAQVAYPVIESNGNEWIDKINKEYENDAKDSIKEALDFYYEVIESEDYPEAYDIAFTLDIDYDVTMDRNGYLSIVTSYATYTGGAHPNSTMTGRTFDFGENKELTLREVFHEESFDLENAVAERIAEKVALYADEEHVQSVHDAAIEEIDHAGFYLTDHAIHVFYVPYQIASYAEGYLIADFPYDPKYCRVDLGDYDCRELIYEIPGNPTTGYEWVLAQDCNKLDISLDYMEPDTNRLGAGGVYHMHVKGVTPGNAAIRLEYRRSWEESPLQTLEYRFYVENDLGVTRIEKNLINHNK